MTPAELAELVQDASTRWPVEFYAARAFRSAEDWSRWASFGFGNSYLGEGEPELSDVLRHRRVAVVGEPGSGKSTVARQAIVEAGRRQWIPVFVRLASYGGGLQNDLAQAGPVAGLAARSVGAGRAERLYILDGLDEVAHEHLPALVADLDELALRDPDGRLLLTCRQAFFADRKFRFSPPVVPFHLLGLSEAGVRAVVARSNVDSKQFCDAVSTLELSDEISNPLVLTGLLKQYRDTGVIGRTRTEAVRHMVGSLLSSATAKHRRGLRMIAVAMETAARNELPRQNAKAVLQRSMRLSSDEADALLDELTRSILHRTTSGVMFQMRSFGEYLAAEELSEVYEYDRVVDLICLEGTRVPSDSWRNTASYLVEMHKGVRHFFTRLHPHWLLGSDTSTFSVSERTAVVNELVALLNQRREYLVHHPTVSARLVGRFAVADVLPSLRAMLTSEDDVVVANAILVLGAAGDRTVADEALRLSGDRTRSAYVRHSALAAIERIGTPSFVSILLEQADRDTEVGASCLDAAAALSDASNIGAVLAALGKTDVHIVSASVRLRSLKGPDEVEAVLDALAQIGPGEMSGRLTSYLEPVWKSVAETWRPSWAVQLSTFILSCESGGGPEDSDLRKLVEHLTAVPDRASAVGRLVCQHLVEKRQDVVHLYHSIALLLSPEDAQWLAGLDGSTELLRTVRAFGRYETVAALRRPMSEPEEAAARLWQQEAEARQRRVDRIRDVAITSMVRVDVLRALSQLDRKNWPDLDGPRVSWLGREIESELGCLDLPRRIRWSTDSSVSVPSSLPLLLEVVEYYGLRLDDDRLIVSTLAYESRAAVRYVDRCGLSSQGMAALEAAITATEASNGGLEGCLMFIRDTKLATSEVIGQLERLGASTSRSTTVRRIAIDCLVALKQVDALLRVRPQLDSEHRKEVDDRLVELQHRPTIERRLGRLLQDPARLVEGEVEHYAHNPLAWVASVKAPEVWTKLVRMRAHAIRRRLPTVGGIVTAALINIDPMGAAGVLRAQIREAPPEWHAHERRRANEIERDARVAAAQSAPFERVLRRMRSATTLDRFKVWVEGPTDRPAFEILAEKLDESSEQCIVVQPLGGWNNILNEHWSPDGLEHGCRGCMLLLDGDGAYDYSKEGLTLKEKARQLLQKLDRSAVQYRVLRRYGLENYFPRHAFESVLNRDLAANFPLDERTPVRIDGYRKDMNPAIARVTELRDFDGTDLAEALARVRHLAGD